MANPRKSLYRKEHQETSLFESRVPTPKKTCVVIKLILTWPLGYLDPWILAQAAVLQRQGSWLNNGRLPMFTQRECVEG